MKREKVLRVEWPTSYNTIKALKIFQKIQLSVETLGNKTKRSIFMSPAVLLFAWNGSTILRSIVWIQNKVNLIVKALNIASIQSVFILFDVCVLTLIFFRLQVPPVRCEIAR